MNTYFLDNWSKPNHSVDAERWKPVARLPDYVLMSVITRYLPAFRGDDPIEGNHGT